MFVPGQASLPLTDRDEGRYIQTTREMLRSENFVDIRLRGETRYKKPVGIYWLQAVTTAPFGGVAAPVWAFRLPSLLCALASVFGVWAIGRILFDPRTGLFAALVFAPTGLIIVQGHLATTDVTLLASILLSQLALASAWRRYAVDAAPGAPPPAKLSWPRAMAFWVGLGAGILIKGPVAPMVVGLTGVVLAARLRSLRGLLALRPIAGILLLVAIVAPWVIAITIVSDGDFLRHFFAAEVIDRASGGLEEHGAPPGLHLLWIFVIGWPMTPFLVLAIPAIVRRWREPPVFFCLAWLVPGFLAFELVATKLPHYTMPLYPALALLAATGVAREGLSWSWPLRLLAGFLLLLHPLSSVIAVFIIPRYLGDATPQLGAAVLAVATLFALWAAILLVRGRVETAIAPMLLSAALLFCGAIAVALPAMQSLWISERLIPLAQSSAGCTDAEIATVGYDEPSLVVLSDDSVPALAPNSAADWLKEPGCRVIAVVDRQRKAFGAAAAAIGLPLREVATLRGYLYQRGRFLTLYLYAQAGAQ